MPLADHCWSFSPGVGIDDLPEEETEVEGYFTNGGVFQGMRPVTTGRSLPCSHAAGTKKTRRKGGVATLFAATISEAQSRGSFNSELDYHHEGRDDWSDLGQGTSTSTLACEHGGFSLKLSTILARATMATLLPSRQEGSP